MPFLKHQFCVLCYFQRTYINFTQFKIGFVFHFLLFGLVSGVLCLTKLALFFDFLFTAGIVETAEHVILNLKFLIFDIVSDLEFRASDLYLIFSRFQNSILLSAIRDTQHAEHSTLLLLYARPGISLAKSFNFS
jgi:hypothetical protein